jgi:hypothetical protein
MFSRGYWNMAQNRLKTCKFFDLAGIIGTILFLSIMFTLDVIQLKYNPILQTISDLVHGSYGWLQTLAFILYGLFFFVFGIRLYSKTIRKKGSFVGACFFSITSIGFFLLAVFPSQANALELTLKGFIHNSVAGLVSTSFIIGCIAFAVHFMADPRWKHYWFYTIMTVALCLTFALLWALLPPEWQLTGLSERALLLCGFVWVSVVSIKLVKPSVVSRESTIYN